MFEMTLVGLDAEGNETHKTSVIGDTATELFSEAELSAEKHGFRLTEYANYMALAGDIMRGDEIVGRWTVEEVDTWSSASRQHWIETGAYIVIGDDA